MTLVYEQHHDRNALCKALFFVTGECSAGHTGHRTYE